MASSQHLQELSCCVESQDKQVLAICLNEGSLETPEKEHMKIKLNQNYNILGKANPHIGHFY